MDLISPKQLVESIKYLQYFGGEPMAKMLLRILKLKRLNKDYGKICHLPAQEFLREATKKFEFEFEVDENELANIPQTGPFITISNHAYGGIDGMILLQIIPSVRPDFKVLANFLLTRFGPLNEYFLGVNPFEAYKNVKSSFGG